LTKIGAAALNNACRIFVNLGGTARSVDIVEKILGDVEDVEVNIKHSLRKKQVPLIVFFRKFF
jgi:hypothetical protein